NMPRIWFFLASTYVHLGDVHRRSGTPERAEPDFRRAFEVYDQHAAGIVKDSAVDAWEMTSDYFRLARLLSSKNPPTDAQQDRAHHFLRQVIDAYGQCAVEYARDPDRRVNALTGYVRVISDCAAMPGFAAEVDELNRRLETELPKLVAD